MVTEPSFDNISFPLTHGDVPNEWGCIQLYVALFGVTIAIHGHESITYKSVWLFATAVVCAAVEVLGYATQRRDDWEGFGHDDPRMLQSVATIIGPTPLFAAHCFIMSNVSRAYSCAVYGGLRPSTAWNINIVTRTSSHRRFRVSVVGFGRKIMLRGVSLHIAVLSFFALFTLEFFRRYALDRPHQSSLEAHRKASPSRGSLTDRLILCLSLLGGSTMLLLVRAIERMLALADGEEGGMVRIEAWLNIFDAAIIIVALSLDDMLHPRWLWEEGQARRNEEEEYLIDDVP
ncbi:uncharacterized protein SCHCODRAFT_02690490 [Schizophyllum commune H4-8]|nr:uncharacterized protein SCHCODRAFT_02690490 [Schizophyllum commune H4-8]KAI5890551.1 hypothetical protein SCHCODRAFT_02690490 [Schizophyllum commune H4-8]